MRANCAHININISSKNFISVNYLFIIFVHFESSSILQYTYTTFIMFFDSSDMQTFTVCLQYDFVRCPSHDFSIASESSKTNVVYRRNPIKYEFNFKVMLNLFSPDIWGPWHWAGRQVQGVRPGARGPACTSSSSPLQMNHCSFPVLRGGGSHQKMLRNTAKLGPRRRETDRMFWLHCSYLAANIK